jgi:hypothetical protein
MLREAVDELKIHLRVRQEIRAGKFRSTRLINGSDWPDAQPPAYRAPTVSETESTKTQEVAA